MQAIFDGQARPVVMGGIYALILLSAVMIALGTMPDLSPRARGLIGAINVLILFAFTLEFLFRLWAAPSRRGYLFSFWGMVDIVACLPWLVLVFPEVQALRALRLMRLFQILKVFRLHSAADRLANAVHAVRAELLLFAFVALIVLYLASVGIYFFEHRVQPDVFTSIPESLWWALATLTTVGYGDMTPITTGGRLFTAFVLLIGLGVVAVPAGIVTSALLNPRQSDDINREKPDGENQP